MSGFVRAFRYVAIVMLAVWLGVSVFSPRHEAFVIDAPRQEGETVSEYRARLSELRDQEIALLEAQGEEVIVGGAPSWLTSLTGAALLSFAAAWFLERRPGPSAGGG